MRLLSYLLLLFLLSPASVLAVDSSELAAMPVLDNGRVKPFDTWAWESMRVVHGSSHPRIEGERIQASELALQIVLEPERWTDAALIRLDDPQLKDILGLPREGRRYSYKQIATDRLQELWHRLDSGHAPARLQRTGHELLNRVIRFEEMLAADWPLLPDPSHPQAPWHSPAEVPEAASSWQKFLGSAQQDDQAGFHQALNDLRRLALSRSPGTLPDASRIEMELFYNRLQPFHKAWIVYLFTLLASLALLARPKPWLRITNRVLQWLGLLLLTTGLGCITYITGRAPVSNLFESLAFVIWSLQVLLLFFSHRTPKDFLYLLSGLLGALTLSYALDSTIDISINPLVPVLRSYWLTLHVTVVTFSYGAFLVSAALGHVWLWMHRRGADHAERKLIDQLNYRCLQLGTLTLALGIILGSVWANVAWGRYWGWDPKETWSLITFFFYLALLHGRLTGWLKQRGSAVAAILGLLVVLMTYFGVNYYLSGLHSYAQGDASTVPLKLGVYLAIEALFLAWTLTARPQLDTGHDN